ncbi:MAG: DUF1553 domain-containing protein, partial [Pirellulaceae bacterium]|nr:DUF1553 domain-containing protein [Pirellulaceae bacterium]
KDPYERMPPPESGKTLTKDQIQLLKDWIAQGARYEGHWAFATPLPPDVPQVDSNWTRNPIDHFVLDRLRKDNLQPSPTADRATLIRRLTLDLTGVPPTEQEVDEFIGDTSDDAYEKLVDRLLMSPKYGERMAVAWLDFARFADSNGFQSDGSRSMWAWRDWLINALNENKPFDQFTIEQLAGDMLPNATRDQIIATGFNRNHRLNGEGGRIVDEWFVETVIDRVETTGLTWLGLTLNCCRCHDHKYDPISQKEFYQLFAFFNSNDEDGVLAPNGKNGDNTPPLLSLATEQQESKLADLKQAAADADLLVKELTKTQPQRLAKWEAARPSQSPTDDNAWEVLQDVVAVSQGGAQLKTLSDGSLLATGKNPPFDTYTITAPIDRPTMTGLRLEVFPHDSLAHKSLARGGNGNFVLTQLNAVLQTDPESASQEITFDRADADFEQPGWTAESLRALQHTTLTDEKIRQGWAIASHEPANRVPRELILTCDQPVDIAANSQLQITMKHASPYAGHNIGCFRLSISDAAASSLKALKSSTPANIAGILAQSKAKRSKKEQKQLREYFAKNLDDVLRNAKQKHEAAKKAAVDYEKSIPSTMVMKETKPREAFILRRGEYDKPGEKVQRGLPAALPSLPEGQPMDRLGLANWIVDPTNPLTARVWVNRAWEHFFGIGLVKTSENFGSQTEYPSHPRLLDWLATQFMRPAAQASVNGVDARAWDMKALHKLIVMSATYRQSSSLSPKLIQRDPDNRLLARGPRFRLSGEVIRDSALSVSGLLIDKVGGPSVRPYMPEKVWDETSVYGNLRNYKHDRGEGLYRRTMYTIWKRTAAPPTMLLFDAPNREVCTIKRSRTNTPLQALSLLNEITFVEAARGLAARMINEGGDDDESRIRFAYKTLFSRQPSADELLVLTSGMESDQKYFTTNPQAAHELTSVGEWTPDTKLDPVQWATYTMTANVLLNLDEFVSRD